MARDLISWRARKAFREHFVGTTLAIIADEFRAAGIAARLDHEPATSGQRRTLVEQYYHSLDFTSAADVRKLFTVYESVLADVETSIESGSAWSEEEARKELITLRKSLEYDGYSYSDGRISPVNNQLDFSQTVGSLSHLDAPQLYQQIERMKAAVDDDPALAVGTAKEFLETCCKTILTEFDIDIPSNGDIVTLVKLARKELGLMPDDIPDAAKGGDIIRRLLSNLATVAQGVAELRNLYGTGHGRHATAKGLKPRHARLAVGAAATLGTFLFETHEERKDEGKADA